MAFLSQKEAYLEYYDRIYGRYGHVFVTYTMYNWLANKVYSGMTHGYHSQTPEEVVRNRYHEHIRAGKTLEKGWEPAKLDQYSASKSCILGREQMLILFYRSKDLAAPENKSLPLRPQQAQAFMEKALKMFGPIPEEGVHKPLPR